MKKIISTILLTIGVALLAKADSEVYIFVNSIVNCNFIVSIDGEEVGDVNGAVKSVKQPVDPMIIPLTTSKDCYRKFNIEGEGNVILTIMMNYTNPISEEIIPYKAEIPLDINDDNTYYLQMSRKGHNDVEIKEIKEKDALKKIKNYQELPAVTHSLK